MAAVIVPIVIILIVIAAIAGFIIYRIRTGKVPAAAAAGAAAPGGECPMQISNVLYDMALEDRPRLPEIPTNFENPMYDNANSNKPGLTLSVSDADDASGIYATLDTPNLSNRSQDGDASPKPKKDVSSSDKAGLIDNMQLDFPGSDQGSSV
jgi:hypothetical protein